MTDQKIIVDLSCGGYTDPDTKEVKSWLSSNIGHMYDHEKELLAKAPGFVGYPHGNFYGSAFIEGTAAELEAFFAEFVKEYDDEHTAREVPMIMERVRRGDRLIRCYHIVWPGRYPEERVDSQTFARMHQVLAHEECRSWSHLGSMRDHMRQYALWEVVNVGLYDTWFSIEYRNGHKPNFSYYEIGFEFNTDETAPEKPKPAGEDFVQFMKCVEAVAGRYNEKLAWFEQHMRQEPR